MTEWTEKDNEEMHKLLGVVLHRVIDVEPPYWRTKCITCNLSLGERNLKEHENLNFSSPSDRELGVMLRWCMDNKEVHSILFFICDTTHDVVARIFPEPKYEYDIGIPGAGNTETIAIRDAIMAYGKVKG